MKVLQAYPPNIQDIRRHLDTPRQALFAYGDDSQITDLHVHKRHDKENPRIEIAFGPTDS